VAKKTWVTSSLILSPPDDGWIKEQPKHVVVSDPREEWRNYQKIVCEDGLIHTQIYNSTTHTGKMERDKVECHNYRKAWWCLRCDICQGASYSCETYQRKFWTCKLVCPAPRRDTPCRVYSNCLKYITFYALDLRLGPVIIRKVSGILSYNIKDRQCMYNLTLRSVHETIVAVEKQWVL
jgi:hypothetical protein